MLKSVYHSIIIISIINTYNMTGTVLSTLLINLFNLQDYPMTQVKYYLYQEVPHVHTHILWKT